MAVILKKNFLFFLSLFLVSFLFSSGSSLSVFSDSIPNEIRFNSEGNSFSFDAHLRPLRQIAGAPEAFYTYFWEFGDGDFSFDEQPNHHFAEEGEYDVRLFATNNYDDGKAPPVNPRRVKVSSALAQHTDNQHDGFFKNDRPLQLKVNRQPKPGEDLVCIIGYQNSSDDQMGEGSVVLFYNDKEFQKKNFGLSDLRKYHGERQSDMATLLASIKQRNAVPVYALNQSFRTGPSPAAEIEVAVSSEASAMLQQKQQLFDSDNTLRFENLEPGEQRYVFAVLHTTPEMIKDTNATLNLSALLIPDDPEAPVFENNLELQIVASHDPNRMMLGTRRLNYRFMGQNKEQKYKVKFQNTGKGPANTVNIGVKLPEMIDPHTLEVKEIYPEVIPCATAESGQSCLDTLITEDSIRFIFKNIYLPGIRQEGVEDKDSTKGFVDYRLRLKEKPPKVPFYSQADIVFDKNEPVYTNKMHTRFIHGISPAIIAGYMMGFNNAPDHSSPFMLGGALSPYSPFRPYLQGEIYFGWYPRSTFSEIKKLEEKEMRDTIFQNREYKVTAEGVQGETKIVSLDMVPLQVRKNMNSWLGIGVGTWLKMEVSKKESLVPVKTLEPVPGTDLRSVNLEGQLIKRTKKFAEFNPAAFIDVNIGRSRVGPALGIRYLHFFSPNSNGLMFYATWRL